MKIALAADLHFGSVPEGLPAELREAILRQQPNVIVIAGDLTLGARRAEFEQAAEWLRSLSPSPLVIPGNHDLPYWNLIRRFADPFHRYRRATGSDTLMPIIEQPVGVVLGFNTSVSWQPHLRWQEGAVRLKDIDAARKVLCSAGPERFKAIVTHHPLLRVPGIPRTEPVRRASAALQAFAESGAGLLMSGHTHQSFAVETQIHGKPMVALGAPAALSARMRGEANGFWIIELTNDAIVCTLWLRDKAIFRAASEKTFKRVRRDG